MDEARAIKFFIPQDVLEAEPRPSSTSSPLLHLPTEILVNIFSETESHSDRVCLALTCRQLIQVSSLIDIEIPSVASHRGLPIRRCDGILRLLSRLKPLDKRGYPKRTVNLCCDCLTYRPKRKGFWKKDEARRLSTKNRQKEVRALLLDFWWWWKEDISFQCPACHLKEMAYYEWLIAKDGNKD